MGRTNLDIRGSTEFLASNIRKVTGRVAVLEAVPNAVVRALDMLAINLNGNFFVIRPKMRGRTTKPCITSPGNGFYSEKINHNVTFEVTRQNCSKVESKARYHLREVRRAKDLAGYKEEDSDWC